MAVRNSPQLRVNPRLVPRAEFVYIIQQGQHGYLALRDPAGAIYPLQEDPSLRGVRITSLRNEFYLLLLNPGTVIDIRKRVFKSGHESLEQLFHECVKSIRIEEAVFNPSVTNLI